MKQFPVALVYLIWISLLSPIGISAVILATPPVRTDPPPPPDGVSVPQFDDDGNPTGPAFKFAPTSPIWSNPTLAGPTWPSLYVAGTLWDKDEAKVLAWNNASAWGRPQWVVTRLPSTATFPIGWLQVGSVCFDGSTYRMRLAGGTLTEVPTVDLQTGQVNTLLAEREVQGVMFKAFVSVPVTN